MIDLYYASTPNGWKITIMLEECGLDYNIVPIDIGAGDQFEPEFLKISPNNRMPALVDTENGLSIFESGAILVYLAEKTGKFLPQDTLGRFNVLQWLFWQVGGLGPMAGQLGHFRNYAPGGKTDHEYAHTRYAQEYDRLFAVMERRLGSNEYLADDYSIADIASWCWIVVYKGFEQSMEAYPGLRRWFDTVKQRPALRKAMEMGKVHKKRDTPITDEERKQRRAMMIGQTGESITQIAKEKES